MVKVAGSSRELRGRRRRRGWEFGTFYVVLLLLLKYGIVRVKKLKSVLFNTDNTIFSLTSEGSCYSSGGSNRSKGGSPPAPLTLTIGSMFPLPKYPTPSSGLEPRRFGHRST